MNHKQIIHDNNNFSKRRENIKNVNYRYKNFTKSIISKNKNREFDNLLIYVGIVDKIENIKNIKKPNKGDVVSVNNVEYVYNGNNWYLIEGNVQISVELTNMNEGVTLTYYNYEVPLEHNTQIIKNDKIEIKPLYNGQIFKNYTGTFVGTDNKWYHCVDKPTNNYTPKINSIPKNTKFVNIKSFEHLREILSKPYYIGQIYYVNIEKENIKGVYFYSGDAKGWQFYKTN